MPETETARGALLERLGQMIESRDFYLKQLIALRAFVENAEGAGVTMTDKAAILVLKALTEAPDG